MITLSIMRRLSVPVSWPLVMRLTIMWIKCTIIKGMMTVVLLIVIRWTVCLVVILIVVWIASMCRLFAFLDRSSVVCHEICEHFALTVFFHFEISPFAVSVLEWMKANVSRQIETNFIVLQNRFFSSKFIKNLLFNLDINRAQNIIWIRLRKLKE